MRTPAVPAPKSLPCPSPLDALRSWSAELMARERRLTLYAALLLALLLPMAVAWGLDERLLRGVNVWVKPMKFAVSIAVLALTTAWFIGHLPAQRRSGRPTNWIVGLLIGTGTFELAYIMLQAALGQGSHYNIGDPWHAAMYALMGLGALLLTGTQLLLAWQLHRHPDNRRPVALRLSVRLGLVLTFVLGAGAGAVLSGVEPPHGGPTVPLLGWALGGGDLRPAHFVGIHAEQALPLVGLLAGRWRGRGAVAVVWIAAVAYAAVFGVLMAWGMPIRG